MIDFLTRDLYLDLGDQTLCIINRFEDYIILDGTKIPKETIKYIVRTIESMERGDKIRTRIFNLEEGK